MLRIMFIIPHIVYSVLYHRQKRLETRFSVSSPWLRVDLGKTISTYRNHQIFRPDCQPSQSYINQNPNMKLLEGKLFAGQAASGDLLRFCGIDSSWSDSERGNLD